MKKPKVKTLQIVSGEADGDPEVQAFTSTRNTRTVRRRLAKAREGGRWAYAQINGGRVEDSDLSQWLPSGPRGEDRGEKRPAGTPRVDLWLDSEEQRDRFDAAAKLAGKSRKRWLLDVAERAASRALKS